jgi:small nuclear ribonucleoprotein (snRNP)-like protein
MAEETTVKEPLDLIKLSLDERVYVKCRGERELRGRLHVSQQLQLGSAVEQLEVKQLDEFAQQQQRRRWLHNTTALVSAVASLLYTVAPV